MFCLRALSESLITPLELKMEEWKKVASQLDKDHAKGKPTCFAQTHTHTHTLPPSPPTCSRCLEYKKARSDIKKKSSDTIKLQKKVKKGKFVQHTFMFVSSPETLQQCNCLSSYIITSKKKGSTRGFMLKSEAAACLLQKKKKPPAEY